MNAVFPDSNEMMKAHVGEVADLLRLLGTPTRLLLLCQIAQRESSVAELERDLGLKQPGLSQQLAELRQSGVVATRRQSRSVYYSIGDARVQSLLAALYGIFCAVDGRTWAVPAAEDSEPAHSGEIARFASVERR